MIPALINGERVIMLLELTAVMINVFPETVVCISVMETPAGEIVSVITPAASLTVIGLPPGVVGGAPANWTGMIRGEEFIPEKSDRTGNRISNRMDTDIPVILFFRSLVVVIKCRMWLDRN